MNLVTRFSGYDFWLEDRTHRVTVRGFVDVEKLERIRSPDDILTRANAFLDRFGLSPPETRKQNMREKLGGDLSNFLFISSVMDYGNIGTSETLSMHLMDMHRKYPFLFRPNDVFWKKLESMNPSEAKKILSSLLMPLSGLFRTDFRKIVVPGWADAIRFLRSKCQGDAGNFFFHLTSSLGIKPDDPAALTVLQHLGDPKESKKFKQLLGISFAIGPKTGQLLLSVMTENRRGFGVLKGVTREQVESLKAPVDSAVARVMLNTGIVKINYVNPSRKEWRFQRSDLTGACQQAMGVLAEKLRMLSTELDQYIWSVGTMPCKHRGAFCFICPLTDICDSWNNGYIRESSGAEYEQRCFSFARPQTGKNALYLRGCQTCPHQSLCQITITERDMRHPKHGSEYVSQRYSTSAEKLTPEELDKILST